MKKLFSLAIVAALFFGPGCAVLNNPTAVSRISSAAKVAAYIGTSEYVRAHPETRIAFETAANSLQQIENAETIDATLLLAIVNELPIKELKSERATIIITATTIIVNDYIGSIPADQVDKIRPLVKAMREGIELGLGNRFATWEEQKLFRKDSAAARCYERQLFAGTLQMMLALKQGGRLAVVR